MFTCQINAIVRLIQQIIFRAWTFRPMNPRTQAERHVLPGDGHRVEKVRAVPGMEVIHDDP
jgi:hypothetical protein